MTVTFKDAHSAKATLQSRLGRRTWLRGIGVTGGPGGHHIRVNVDAMTDDARSAIPDFVNGVAVEVAVVGNIRSALRK